MILTLVQGRAYKRANSRASLPSHPRRSVEKLNRIFPYESSHATSIPAAIIVVGIVVLLAFTLRLDPKTLASPQELTVISRTRGNGGTDCGSHK